MPSPFDTGLDKNPANFQPLTPLTFLKRAAAVFPDQPAVIHDAELCAIWCPRPTFGVGACPARCQAGNDRVGHARQHPTDA